MAGWIFLPRCSPIWAHSRPSIPRVDLSRCKMRAARRGDGAVERAGLENRNTRKRIVGSNPTLSANPLTPLELREHQPVGFPTHCRRNDNEPRQADAASDAASRRLVRLAFRNAVSQSLKILVKP